MKSASKKQITEARAAGVPVLDAVIRVSQRAGREGDTFMSPVEQIDKVMQGVHSGRYVVATWHDETDSVSGSEANFDKREGLQLALTRALDGTTDGVVVARLNRFARSLVQGVGAVRKLHDAGKHFVSIEEGISGSANSPSGKQQLSMLFSMAEYQLDTLTASWQDTRRRHVARGAYTKQTFGYDKLGKGQPFTVNAEEAAYVRKMFELRAAGSSWSQIADYMNDHGVKTRGSASHWRAQRIKRVIENRLYLGEIHLGDAVNLHAHDPIVTVELFDAANSRRAAGKRSRDRQYALTGIIYCAGCGGRAFGKTQRSGDKELRYYTCTGKHAGERCPAPLSTPAGDIEAFVLDAFKAAFVKRDGITVDCYDGAADAIAAAQAKLDSAQVEVAAYVSDPASLKLQGINRDAWSAGLDVRADAVLDAERELSEAMQAKHGLAVPHDIALRIDDMTDAELNVLYVQAFELVACASAGRVGRVNRAPISDRARVWLRGDHDAPVRTTDRIVPIVVQ